MQSLERILRDEAPAEYREPLEVGCMVDPADWQKFGGVYRYEIPTVDTRADR